MISAGRCTSSDSGGRTAIMSKECRVVNGGGGPGVGGGYVNHCEQALDAKNEMVMAASKIAVATGVDLTATAVNNCVCSEVGTLKEFSLSNMDLINGLKVLLIQKDEKIIQLTKQMESLQQNLDQAKQYMAEAAKEESLDVLPFTPVSSTCSSGMGDLSSAELPEQQEVKPKKRKSRQAIIKQPTSDSLELNPTKRQRTRSSRNKSADTGKMHEVSLITADGDYYTCLGNFDPIKDDPEQKQIPKKKGYHEEDTKNLEIPSWRIKTYSSWYSMEGTENMSDDIFENRHSRLEIWERKRKRWDMQRIRELRRVEYLKEGRNKHHTQNSNETDKEELTTLLPNPTNITWIEITENVPVSAFGFNLHIKKKSEQLKINHSKWCNDWSQMPQESNVRELRSSGRGQSDDTT